MNVFVILTSFIIILTNLVTLLEGGFFTGFGSSGFRPTNNFASRPIGPVPNSLSRPIGPVPNSLSTYNGPRPSFGNRPTFTNVGQPSPARTRPPHFYPSSGSSISRSRSPSPKSHHHSPLPNSHPLPGSHHTPLPGSQRTPLPGSQRTPRPGSQHAPLPGSQRTPLPGSQHTALPPSSLPKKPSIKPSTSLIPTNARTPSPQRLPSAPLPKEFTIETSQKPRSRSPPGYDSETIAVKKLFSGDQSSTPPRSRSTSPVLPSAPLPKAFLNELASSKNPIAKEKETKLSHEPGSTEFYLNDKTRSEIKPVSLSGSQNAPAIASKNKPEFRIISKPKSKPKLSGVKHSGDPESKSGATGSNPAASKTKNGKSPLNVKPLAAAGIGTALLSSQFLKANKIAHTASVNPGHLTPPVSRVLDQGHFPVAPKTVNHKPFYSPVSPRPRFKWNPSEALISVVKKIG